MMAAPTPAEYVHAAKCPETIPTGDFFGFWSIRRIRRDESILGELGLIDGPYMTMLFRWTMANIHLPFGDVVMEDSLRELRRHLPLWMNARGRVLLTGLGLGCCARGLAINPNVQHVDIIEIDRDILAQIGPEFAANPKFTFHRADALKWRIPRSSHWDVAWHDIHDDNGQLQVLHGFLIRRFAPYADIQGAWSFPRIAKRIAGPHMRLIGGKKRDRFLGAAA